MKTNEQITKMPPLIQSLFDGPIDIVGDVHGEIDALRSLLNHLGYDEKGNHRQNRRLIFLGDLTDRGPDSPAVVDLIHELVESGNAQCVLGNHDLNILLDHQKPENKWFWGKEFIDEHGNVIPQKLVNDETKERVKGFFCTLPIALERDDLRIVHACWNDGIIEAVRHETDVVKVYKTYAKRIDAELANQALDDVEFDLQHQNRNPVKLLTSGPEERSESPIFSGGRWRKEKRMIWWTGQNGPLCLFGHYAIPDGQPRGTGSAFCMDYGVGHRWRERREGKASRFKCRLAAMRFPERAIVFDDGEVRSN